MSTVVVLMSTYNGEKFIREQIDSILNQKSVQVELLIRDDGSSDSTQAILQEYVQQYKNVNFYQGENVGVGRSFMDLLKNAPQADYYAYADQDDFWLEDKLERAIRIMEDAYTKESELIYNKEACADTGSNIPILYASNQMLVNEKLEKLGMRFLNEPRHDLIQEIASNKLSGCTMVMNKELREIAIKKENLPDDYILYTRLHDTWTVIMACIFGIVLYDENTGILYRQHEKNVVGAKRKTVKQIINDKYIRLKSKKYKANRTILTQFILDKFISVLSNEVIEQLKVISNCKSINGAVSLFRNKNIRCIFNETGVLLFMKCLLGWI